jgi:hypothetical protein
MTQSKFDASNDRTVLTTDELTGVLGGCGSPAQPMGGAAPSAQGATTAGQHNWGGGQNNGRRTN